MIGAIFIGLYGVSLLVIFFYAVIQFSLAVSYLRFKKNNIISVKEINENFPLVTIQLPIYNEKYVVERLLRKTSEIDWPKDKLEIQVLDDSTDETKEILEKLVAEFQTNGIPVILVRRTSREGLAQ